MNDTCGISVWRNPVGVAICERQPSVEATLGSDALPLWGKRGRSGQRGRSWGKRGEAAKEGELGQWDEALTFFYDQPFFVEFPFEDFDTFFNRQCALDIIASTRCTQERDTSAATRTTNFRCFSSVCQGLLNQHIHLRRGYRRSELFPIWVSLLHCLRDFGPIICKQGLANTSGRVTNPIKQFKQVCVTIDMLFENFPVVNS